MSNPEKTKMDIEEEIIESSDESDYAWSDEDVREIVLALPAMRISENVDDQANREQTLVTDEQANPENTVVSDDHVIGAQTNVMHDDQSTVLHDQAIAMHDDQVTVLHGQAIDNVDEQAIVAAALVLAVAQEMAATEGKANQRVGGVDGSGEADTKKKLGRPRKIRVDSEAKKSRKKGSLQLHDPPQGPPTCNVCRRQFASWKAVFGHLRTHKDRGYLGFFPPPAFDVAEGGSGTVVAASSGTGGSGLGTGGLNIDLNEEPTKSEEEEAPAGSMFDLNRSPPHEEEEGANDENIPE